jgi:magnesium-transporting ATPase (P-type)
MVKSENFIAFLLCLGSWALATACVFFWFTSGTLGRVFAAFGILLFGVMAIVYSVMLVYVFKVRKKMAKK